MCPECTYFCTARLLYLTHKETEGVKLMKYRRFKMKGYVIANGYMGYVNGSYLLFASEADYREYMED